MYLDQSVKQAGGGAQAVDGLFGKAYLFSQERNPAEALERYNVILSLFPDYMPALIEKARAHLALADWEAAMDTCVRCHEREPNCIGAHRIIVLHQLCRNVGNTEPRIVVCIR